MPAEHNGRHVPSNLVWSMRASHGNIKDDLYHQKEYEILEGSKEG